MSVLVHCKFKRQSKMNWSYDAWLEVKTDPSVIGVRSMFFKSANPTCFLYLSCSNKETWNYSFNVPIGTLRPKIVVGKSKLPVEARASMTLRKLFYFPWNVSLAPLEKWDDLSSYTANCIQSLTVCAEELCNPLLQGTPVQQQWPFHLTTRSVRTSHFHFRG